MARRQSLHFKVSQKKRIQRLLFRAGFSIGGIVFLVGVAAVGAHQSEVRIQEVTLSGNAVVRTSDVLESVWSDITGNYLFLFPKNSVLLYPRNGIKAHTLAAFPRFDSIEVNREGLTKLEISVHEREPYALWCGAYGVTTSTSCIFFDRSGFLFDQAPDFSGTAYIKYFSASGGIGTTFLGYDKLGQFEEIFAVLQAEGFEPVHVAFKDEQDGGIMTSSGVEFLFTNETPLHVLKENLKTVLESDGFQKEKDGDLEYVDLRFGNKVYYK